LVKHQVTKSIYPSQTIWNLEEELGGKKTGHERVGLEGTVLTFSRMIKTMHKVSA